MLKSRADRIETCTFCPNLCLHTCPVSNAERKSSVSPWAKMSLVQWIREGLAPMNAETVDILYKCTGCGTCTSACVHGVPVGDVLMEARSEAVSRGLKGPAADRRKTDTRALETIRGEKDQGPLQGKTVYWPGCKQAVRDIKTLEATQRVIERLAGTDVSLGPAVCCGETEVSNGRALAGKNNATALGYVLAEAERVLVGPGSCQAHLAAARSDVESLVPFVLKALLANPEWIPSPLEGRVAIFESCAHVRKIGVSDQSVALASRLAAGGVIELRWCGEQSHCCGAGGGFAETSPESARIAGRRVLEMAEDAEASILISFDAECVAHLKGCEQIPGVTVLSAMELLDSLMVEP